MLLHACFYFILYFPYYIQFSFLFFQVLRIVFLISHKKYFGHNFTSLQLQTVWIRKCSLDCRCLVFFSFLQYFTLIYWNVIHSQLYPSRCINEEKYEYHLVGLVEHSGTMRGGHYVAYVRGGQRNSGKGGDKENEGSTWYQASDAYVREVSLDEVLRCEAYILFYEKI